MTNFGKQIFTTVTKRLFSIFRPVMNCILCVHRLVMAYVDWVSLPLHTLCTDVSLGSNGTRDATHIFLRTAPPRNAASAAKYWKSLSPCYVVCCWHRTHPISSSVESDTKIAARVPCSRTASGISTSRSSNHRLLSMTPYSTSPLIGLLMVHCDF